jgi:hypothetical protein
VVDVGAGSGILSLFAAQVRSKLLTGSFTSLSDNLICAVFHIIVRLVPNTCMQLRHLKWLNMPSGLFQGTHRSDNESRFVSYRLDLDTSLFRFPLFTGMKLCPAPS